MKCVDRVLGGDEGSWLPDRDFYKVVFSFSSQEVWKSIRWFYDELRHRQSGSQELAVWHLADLRNSPWRYCCRTALINDAFCAFQNKAMWLLRYDAHVHSSILLAKVKTPPWVWILVDGISDRVSLVRVNTELRRHLLSGRKRCSVGFPLDSQYQYDNPRSLNN